MPIRRSAGGYGIFVMGCRVGYNPRMDGPPGKTRLVDVLKRSGFVGGIAGALAGAVGALVVVSKMRRKKA